MDGGGSSSMAPWQTSVENRLGSLQGAVEQQGADVRAEISDVRTEIRDVRAGVREVRRDVRWWGTVMVTLLIALAGFMARGFGWW